MDILKIEIQKINTFFEKKIKYKKKRNIFLKRM